jgi:hypothetical protein
VNEAVPTILALIPALGAIAWAIASVRRVLHAAREDAMARRAFVPAVEILAFRAPEHVPAALRAIFNGRPAVREDRLIEIKPTRSPAKSRGPTKSAAVGSSAAAMELPPSDRSVEITDQLEATSPHDG